MKKLSRALDVTVAHWALSGLAGTNSLTIYSTYKLNHDEPGVIAE